MKKKNKGELNSGNIIKTAYIFFALFILLIGYLSYFLIFQSSDVVNNPYNKRQEAFVENVIRGTVYSRDYDILATTNVDDDGTESRVYPYANLFAQSIGYNTNGKLGVELFYNYDLLTSDTNFFEKLVNEFKDEKDIGNNVITTFDVELQEVADDAIGDNKGAIIAIDPDTGEILSMISKPDFNPNEIEVIYDDIINDDSQTSLINRTTQGLYTPGSIFKLFTLYEYIKENPDYENYNYQCNGSVLVEDVKISCFNNTVHGYEDLLESFANSCNSSFINLGLTLDKENFQNTCEELLFNNYLSVDFSYNKSELNINENTSDFMMAQTVMGQGETLVTPLHMAMIISSIANDGVLMKPYMVKYVENYQGKVIKETDNEKYGSFFTEDECEVLKKYLREVVLLGTASELNTEQYTVYGKTGTAQIDSGDNENSWFIGYGEKDGEKLVVAVVFEEVKPGSKYGVLAAKQLFDEYFKS